MRRHEAVSSTEAADQQLMRTINHALHDWHPLTFLDMVSAILSTCEPKRDPMTGPVEPATSLDNLVESFEGVDLAATTGALHVMAAMTPDELLAARIRRTLAERRQRLPAWVTSLSEVEIRQVVEMRHVLRDGENYFLDVRLPDGFGMTVCVYVDNNLGRVVKDAYTLDQPWDVVHERIGEIVEPDTIIAPADPAAARAVLDAALQVEAIMFPPMESETWPACRPLVRWLVGKLPAGASLPDFEMPSEAELDEIADEFLRSPYGKGFDDEDHRRLLEVIVGFGATYDVGDPLRWSPVNVELMLVDRVPRKVVDKVSVLTKLPALMRAFIRYAYDVRGLRRELLQEALESVDRWEPEYQRLIRTPRVQGAEALARMMMGEETGLELELGPYDPLEELVAAVGGEDELEDLTDEPLPDEEFEWLGIEEDIRPKLEEILALCDANANELLDVEHRTANRRLLRDLAIVNPAYFRGRAAARTSAAAISYMVAHANGTLSAYGPLTAGALLKPFGVSTVGQRKDQFRSFLGLPRDLPSGRPMSLGAPDYLVGARRQALIVERDRLDAG